MATLIPQQIDALSHEMRVCAALAGELAAVCDRLLTGLEAPVDTGLEAQFEHPVQAPAKGGILSPGMAGFALHRAEHRMGTPSRIATDPALAAFRMARVTTRTFGQLAQDVADAFAPERRVGASGIHRWWQRNRPRNR